MYIYEFWIAVIFISMFFPEAVLAGVITYIVTDIFGFLFVSIEMFILSMIIQLPESIDKQLSFWTPYVMGVLAASEVIRQEYFKKPIKNNTIDLSKKD